MSNRFFSSEQKAKLGQLFKEGIAVMTEIEDLNTGLNDTIKSVAEEMEIKPGVLKKALKIAQKSKYTDHKASEEELEDIFDEHYYDDETENFE